MQFYGCYLSRNGKDIMEVILWKFRTGTPWCDIPDDFCLWQTVYNCFNCWTSRGLWENFLNGEAYWIKNGSSLTEVTFFVCINMQAELSMAKLEQLAHQEAELLQRYTSCFTRQMSKVIV
ncbi:transposase [Acinetobacter sp. ANC 4633]|nr:transposase [Acinetobacter sp. ANC 4633]